MGKPHFSLSGDSGGGWNAAALGHGCLVFLNDCQFPLCVPMRGEFRIGVMPRSSKAPEG